MNSRLHEVLDRTAELADPAGFDPDELWRLGARSRRRRIVGLALCALLVLAALPIALLLESGPNRSNGSVDAPSALPAGLALPRRVYAVPSYVSAQHELDIGPVAVTMLSNGGSPVAVSARDGSYHVLDLPGFDGIGPNAPALAVSPDATQIAYAWLGPAPAVSGRHVPSGIRVLDTVTGLVRSYPVAGGLAAECGSIVWSANARFVAFTCVIDDDISQHASGGSDGHVGRIDLRSGSVSGVDSFFDAPAPAVSDLGTVAIAAGSDVKVWRPGAAPTLRSHTLHGSAFSVAWRTSDELDVVSTPPRTHSQSGTTIWVLNSRLVLQDSAVGVLPGRTVAAVGSVSSGEVVLWGATADSHADQGYYTMSASGGPLLRLSAPGTSAFGNEPEASGLLTVATDLFAGPPRDSGPPRWPTDWHAVVVRSLEIGVPVIGLSLLAWLVWWRRREQLFATLVD